MFGLTWTHQWNMPLLLLFRMGNAWVLSNTMISYTILIQRTINWMMHLIFPIQSLVSTTDNNIPKDKINTPITNYYVACSFLNTVSDNKKSFSNNQIEVENHARTLQQLLGWPNTTTYKSYIETFHSRL